MTAKQLVHWQQADKTYVVARYYVHVVRCDTLGQRCMLCLACKMLCYTVSRIGAYLAHIESIAEACW
jgi:hypothetical protein